MSEGCLPLLKTHYFYRELHAESVVVFACAPSSLDPHVRTALQQKTSLDREIEIWDIPELNLHGLHSEGGKLVR